MSQKTLPPPDLVAGWDIRHVADWLRHNDIPEFIGPFRNNSVDGCRLLELDESTIKSFNLQISPQKITKLLEKVKKSKKERTGLFTKLKQSRNHSPAVPDRDYKKCTNSYPKPEEEDNIWDSDFDDDDDPEDNYEPPPDPMRSEAPRYPQPTHPSHFNRPNIEINDDGPEELYIEPIEDVQSHETANKKYLADDEIDEEEYLAPDRPDELYEVPEDDSHFQPRIPATIKPPPARPPKTNKDIICKQSRQLPQMLVPAPSLCVGSSDVPPRPPARRSVSPVRTPLSPRRSSSPIVPPYSYRLQPEIHEEFEEDTYDNPNNEEIEDYDDTYAVPDEETLHHRPVQPRPISVSHPKVNNKPTGFIKPPARVMLPISSKNAFNSSNNDLPAVPPPIIRYPKTDSSKPPKEPPSKKDVTPPAGVSKMMQVFEQRSPTLPRRDNYNGTNKVQETKNSSFLHKRIAQPPLPSKSELPSKEPNTQPELPRRKPLVLQKPHAIPDSNSSSVLSTASKLSDSLKLQPNPTQRTTPNPAQQNFPNPSPRNTPNASNRSPQNTFPRNLPSPSHATAPKPTPSNAFQNSAANSMDGYPWYHADLAREKAQKSLEDCRRDGAFLVRDSKRGGLKHPFTISLWYNNQVRNLQMRRRTDDKYALGSMKEGEQTFESPLELVEFHQINPLILANNEGKTKLKHQCPVF